MQRQIIRREKTEKGKGNIIRSSENENDKDVEDQRRHYYAEFRTLCGSPTSEEEKEEEEEVAAGESDMRCPRLVQCPLLFVLVRISEEDWRSQAASLPDRINFRALCSNCSSRHSRHRL